MFFSKIVNFWVLEEQIDENPTSYGWILMKLGLHTGVSPDYSKNFMELRQEEDGFFEN